MQLPAALTSRFGKQILLVKENAPQILFAGGIGAGVASTVMACKATLKVEATLHQTKKEISDIQEAKDIVEAGGLPKKDDGTEFEYTVEEADKDLRLLKAQGLIRIAKLYAPAVGLGFISIALLTKSQHILKERNAGLVAAYTAVTQAFENYRERVVEDQGEEKDLEYLHGVEEREELNPETNRKRKVKSPLTAGSPYAKFFDETRSSFGPDPHWNFTFLHGVQNHCNHRLNARGHLFLNEVYTDLGIPHTQAGAVVGWIKGEGDGYVDFGIFDQDSEPKRDFIRGREGAILLDFNVDGVIYDKITEEDDA